MRGCGALKQGRRSTRPARTVWAVAGCCRPIRPLEAAAAGLGADQPRGDAPADRGESAVGEARAGAGPVVPGLVGTTFLPGGAPAGTETPGSTRRASRRHVG